MKHLVAVFLLLCNTTVLAAFDHTHSAYDQLLKDVVVTHGHQTSVNYNKLKNESDLLKDYVRSIESVSRNEFNQWSSNQQLAFLINAYNALTLDLIIMNYPGIDSIRDLGGLVFSTPWNKEFFTLFGEPATLDHIEHELIRENFEEPRIHFAVNCASRSCPPLQPDAYVADKLDSQLEYATKQFLTDPERNRYNAKKMRLELSSIFNWYKRDFVEAAGSLGHYVAPYITEDAQVRKKLKSPAASLGEVNSITFLDYDWALNDTASR